MLLPDDHPFATFQISERLAAANKENRELTREQVKALECSAEYRNARENEDQKD